MRFIRFTTQGIRPAIIDPGTIRAFLPSQHGDHFTLLVLDGGQKVHVNNGGPDETFRDANPGAEDPLPGFVRGDGPTQLPTPIPAPLVPVANLDSPTASFVAAFALAMEDRLSRNRHKGDRAGWLKEPVLDHIEKALKHLKELETALLHGRVERHDFERLAADCANRLMMARDTFLSPTDGPAA